MDGAILLAMLDQAAVVFGLRPPPGVARVLIQQPQLAAEEPFAPVGPGLAAVSWQLDCTT
jgi:hypothetical protein